MISDGGRFFTRCQDELIHSNSTADSIEFPGAFCFSIIFHLPTRHICHARSPRNPASTLNIGNPVVQKVPSHDRSLRKHHQVAYGCGARRICEAQQAERCRQGHAAGIHPMSWWPTRTISTSSAPWRRANVNGYATTPASWSDQMWLCFRVWVKAIDISLIGFRQLEWHFSLFADFQEIQPSRSPNFIECDD